MIMIPVDEADAWDRYAIATVKYDENVKDIIWYALALQMDTQTIFASPEYSDLLEANKATFRSVEKAKRNECSAQDVDRANHSRYLAKKALQAKFFPRSPLTETKTERPYANKT